KHVAVRLNSQSSRFTSHQRIWKLCALPHGAPSASTAQLTLDNLLANGQILIVRGDGSQSGS
ncbi:hypothetical protein PENTCL1PPCAC_10467, partial [Pristionchus entomophagus]